MVIPMLTILDITLPVMVTIRLPVTPDLPDTLAVILKPRILGMRQERTSDILLERSPGIVLEKMSDIHQSGRIPALSPRKCARDRPERTLATVIRLLHPRLWMTHDSLLLHRRTPG